MLNVIVFVAGSAGGSLLLFLPNTYCPALSRVYRFLAFEALLGLALLARGRWFVDPLSAPEVISWAFWMAGLAVGLLAAVQWPTSHPARTPVAAASEEPPILPPPRGIYRRVRHPFYGAALLAGWGVFAQSLMPFDDAILIYALLLTGASLFLVSAARADETADYLKFGSPYALYARSSKMLIPFIL